MRIITIGFSTLAIAALLSGCAAVDSLTDATKDKSIAAGSDTWGGGADISAVSAESPVPNLSAWFGRRKVWYVSVKDKSTGEAAAKVVKARPEQSGPFHKIRSNFHPALVKPELPFTV